ncbi:hypothetical protein PV10_08624 [Exophiala mesophila]|uniref:Uncharacterized protein n=1 Tax=Exophiala mesophila TaxID=212818 RepID=A0A0D1WJJ3_EXOME|nr:uncharacterized protein PV10_08624 [Exophiala mesophila]KIV89005.1 hypothetical protein PV10_08624 [Exophiala mesophila]
MSSRATTALTAQPCIQSARLACAADQHCSNSANNKIAISYVRFFRITLYKYFASRFERSRRHINRVITTLVACTAHHESFQGSFPTTRPFLYNHFSTNTSFMVPQKSI